MRAADKMTSATAIIIDGVTFHCYRTGILRYQWRSEDGRVSAGRRGTSTFYGRVGCETINKRFRTLENAMRAAVAARW